MWYCIMLKVVVPPAFINMQFIELPVSQVPLWNMSIWDWNGDGIVSACHFVVDNALGAYHKYALPPPPPRALETCARGQSRDGWTTQPTEWPASIPKLPLERCPDPHVKWGLPPPPVVKGMGVMEWAKWALAWAWEWPNAKSALSSSCPSSWAERRSDESRGVGSSWRSRQCGASERDACEMATPTCWGPTTAPQPPPTRQSHPNHQQQWRGRQEKSTVKR